MTAKFIRIKVDPEVREAFQKKAKANGMTMTQLVQGWIDEYLAPEQTPVDSSRTDQDEIILQRLEALEEKVEMSLKSSTTDEENQDKITKYIRYVDQRIDTLETVVLNPMKDELKGLKKSWKALFNQVREFEENLTKITINLEKLKSKTQEQFNKITQFINHKLH